MLVLKPRIFSRRGLPMEEAILVALSEEEEEPFRDKVKDVLLQRDFLCQQRSIPISSGTANVWRQELTGRFPLC